MKQILFLFITVVFITDICLAEGEVTDAHVIGDVQCDGVHIPYINIFIKGTTIGTTSDATGHYQLINLPVGTHTVVAQGVGYKKAEVEVVTRLNTTEEIKFKLEEDVLNLESVVVTADRHESSRAEAPVIVNTLTPKLLESTQAISIATGLDFVPGLRMECNCSNCGFSQVRMNGMDGPYSQILINSRPVFSGLAGVYGLELIPASMVERIEVVRGGGSALFGGNAIAGTINVITRTPSVNAFSVEGRYGFIGLANHEGTRPAGDRLLNLNGSIVSDDLRTGMSFFGMLRDRDAFDENGDGYSEMVSMENTTFGINAFHKLSQKAKLSLDLYRINEFRRGGNKFDLLPHEADIAEQVDHKITGSNISLDLFMGKKNLNKLMLYAAAQWVDRGSYYGAEQDPNAYGQTNDLTYSIGGQYHMSFSEKSNLMIGLDNNHNRIEDIKLGANGAPNTSIINQFTNTIGSFAQYEWHAGIFKTTLGLRYDTYLIRDLDHGMSGVRNEDVRGNVLAPRVSLLTDITPTLQWRLSYSKGYRPPQVFDEDLHIESSGSRRIVHVNSPGLKQETSHAFSSSLRLIKNFGPVLTELVAEGFYTRLLDPFAYEYQMVDSSKTLYQIRENADHGAFVGGVNFEFNAAFPHDITMQAGLTVQTSKYDTPQPWGEGEDSYTDIFLRSPNSYGYLTLEWHPVDRLSTSITANYTGSMYVPHYGLAPITDEEWEVIEESGISSIESGRASEIEAILNGDVIEGERLEKTEQFLIFGMRVGYDFPISTKAKLQVYAGVQNMFNQMQAQHDRGIFRDAGYIYGPCQPRTINVGVKFGNFF